MVTSEVKQRSTTGLMADCLSSGPVLPSYHHLLSVIEIFSSSPPTNLSTLLINLTSVSPLEKATLALLAIDPFLEIVLITTIYLLKAAFSIFRRFTCSNLLTLWRV